MWLPDYAEKTRKCYPKEKLNASPKNKRNKNNNVFFKLEEKTKKPPKRLYIDNVINNFNKAINSSRNAQKNMLDNKSSRSIKTFKIEKKNTFHDRKSRYNKEEFKIREKENENKKERANGNNKENK